MYTVWDLRFGVPGLRFRVYKVKGLGFGVYKVEGLRFRTGL